ncbi:MAG: HNH endonuclease [Thermoanaerobaculia bacterium]
MRIYVAVTDPQLYRFLRARPELDEVNFWQPSGSRRFRALEPGEPFLFKLHSPDDFIVGGGFFAASAILPVGLAWQIFDERNGSLSLGEMRRHIGRYRRGKATSRGDHPIGCIVLQRPFFFDEADWIPVPKNFKKSIVQGKSYDSSTPAGRGLWEAVRLRLQAVTPGEGDDGQADMFGEPVLIHPRMGPGAWRVLVIEAYQRRCALTGDCVLPALETAFIRPQADGGLLRVDNGLLMRADLRRLFDAGYLTVTRDRRVRISPRLKEAFGETPAYDALDGREIAVPEAVQDRPRDEFLSWHQRSVFRA